MPSACSRRRFTESLATIALTVKCFPMSRRNSIREAVAGERDRRMAEALQPGEPHDGHQRTDVQAGRGGIEPDVRRHLLLGQQVAHSLRPVIDEATPLEFVEYIHPGTLRRHFPINRPRQSAY